MSEDDLDRIRRGGIPLGAAQRLKRISSAGSPFFTSDLSAKEYAVAQVSRMQPLAQIMGSSVVQLTEAPLQAGSSWGSSEINALSAPWNVARSRAFERLRQEARFAGADAVIGIKLDVRQVQEGVEALECVAFGTAVRDAAFPTRKGDKLGMCALSGQEVYRLRRLGAKICGVVCHTTVNSIKLETESNHVLNSMRRSRKSRNAELPEMATGIAETRRRALAAVRGQASGVGANHLVISELRHDIRHHFYGAGQHKHHYFYVTFHVVGTAIKTGARQPHPAPMPVPTIAMNINA
jgi:uncharacterized protein YbjQ (UPF0145 family)